MEVTAKKIKLNNASAEIEKADNYNGSLVSIGGNKGIDVFVHYDSDGTFRSASVWNGKNWIDTRSREG